MLFISGVAVNVAACWPLALHSRIKATYDSPLRMFRATWTLP